MPAQRASLRRALHGRQLECAHALVQTLGEDNLWELLAVAASLSLPPPPEHPADAPSPSEVLREAVVHFLAAAASPLRRAAPVDGRPADSPKRAMEEMTASLKIERIQGQVDRTRDQARADVFDYIERFYNPRRRHSTLGYLSPMDYERKAMKA